MKIYLVDGRVGLGDDVVGIFQAGLDHVVSLLELRHADDRSLEDVDFDVLLAILRYLSTEKHSN